MSPLFGSNSDFKDDHVMGERFEKRWKKTNESQRKSFDLHGEGEDPNVLIMEFLRNYYYKFDSEASLDPVPGTDEEETLFSEIRKNISYYQKWLFKMTEDIARWDDRWSPALKVLIDLHTSRILVSAEGKSRTYRRNIPDVSNAHSLNTFDLIFIELKRHLQSLAAEIARAYEAFE